ncbi:MAG: hypothetical protein IJJ33_16620, partial [Victivallales bacterium]|nr:hypothetical protein [Victivallales bacterium]
LLRTGTGDVLLSWEDTWFDVRHRLVRREDSRGRVRTASWGCCGKESETLEDGAELAYARDLRSRLVSRARTAFGGRPAHVTSYSHDAEGRLLATAVSSGGLSLAESWTYDLAGRVAWRRNALGKCARHAYDGAGRVVRVWGDTEYPAEYAYDVFGDLVTLTTFRAEAGGDGWAGEDWPNPAPAGDVTSWLRDPATGLVSAKRHADGHGPSYTYDAQGRVATRTRPKATEQKPSILTSYTYDGLGRLVRVSYSTDDKLNFLAYNDEYHISYTRFGAWADYGGVEFTYDEHLRVSGETSHYGHLQRTLTRTWMSEGLKGQPLALSVDGELVYRLGRDPYGRIDRITTSMGDFLYERLPGSDLVARMTRPNGIVTEWSYEPHRDLVTQVRNGEISVYGYAYDEIGRRTSMTRSGEAHPVPDAVSYSYDDRSQLLSAVSNQETSYFYQYGYDCIGNRVNAREEIDAWAFETNGRNQYVRIAENGVWRDCTYNADGTLRSLPTAGGQWLTILDYDQENRPVELWQFHGKILHTDFDRLGRAVMQRLSDTATGDQGVWKAHLHDGWRHLEEWRWQWNAPPAMQSRLLWQPLEIGQEAVLAKTENGQTLYFLHDADKNIVQVTDSEGRLVSSHSYSPFGKQRGGFLSPGFSSERSEPTWGLSLYHYRQLYPVYGRWLSEDPLGESVSLNLYSFLENNPVGRTDYLGLASWLDVIPIIGTVRGFYYANSAPGTSASDYSSIKVSADECCKAKQDQGGVEDVEALCERKIDALRARFFTSNNQGLFAKTGIDLATAFAGLKTGHIGILASGLLTLDSLAGLHAVFRNDEALDNAANDAKHSNCKCP